VNIGKLKSLVQFGKALRSRQRSRHTEQTNVHRVKRFINYHEIRNLIDIKIIGKKTRQLLIQKETASVYCFVMSGIESASFRSYAFALED
jgi:hypothetical protein